MKKRAWFDTKTYPTARFVSESVKALGGNRYEVAGKMTIKGKTNPVVAPFTFKQDGANGLFEGMFPIKRLQYGIGDGIWSDPETVADDVQIKFRFVAAPKK